MLYKSSDHAAIARQEDGITGEWGRGGQIILEIYRSASADDDGPNGPEKPVVPPSPKRREKSSSAFYTIYI